jgi:hypothetical protein
MIFQALTAWELFLGSVGEWLYWLLAGLIRMVRIRDFKNIILPFLGRNSGGDIEYSQSFLGDNYDHDSMRKKSF